MEEGAAPDRRPSNQSASLRIGELLIQAGLISREQAGDAAKLSVERKVRFGEAAVVLGLVTTEEVENALGGNLDGRALIQKESVSDALFFYHAPDSVASEDVRALRNHLALRWFQHDGGGRALSIISPGRQEGRSLCAANLAVAFAQVGLRTLLIDADMRNPSQHQLFNLSNKAGLSGYLAERAEDAAHYTIATLETLTIIPVGPLPPSPQELLLRPTLETLLHSAAQQFEVVLVDTPAASAGSDYQITAKATRGALMLARGRTSRMRDAARMVADCREVGVEIVGGSFVTGSARRA